MKSFLWVIPFLGLLFACGNNPSPAPGPGPIVDGDTKYFTGLIKDPDRFYGVMHFIPKRAARAEAGMPAEYDVETDGGKTPMRDQGQCGSCWAFGGTQTFEIGMQKFGGKTIDFSEQDLVGKLFYGCDGGYFTGEFQMKTGQTDEASCKYRASNYKCTAPIVAKAVNWGLVGQPNRQPTDEELQNAILTYGSVAATVGADNSFRRIKGFAQGCPSTGTNHIIALVGWKTNPDDGKIYFKIKNSWGTTWGDSGYGYVRRGCWNLAEEASWLAVEKTPCLPPKAHLPKGFTLSVGDEVRLAVKPEANVTYEWYNANTKLSDGPTLDLVGTETFVVTLKAKNSCGNAEVISMVNVAKAVKNK